MATMRFFCATHFSRLMLALQQADQIFIRLRIQTPGCFRVRFILLCSCQLCFPNSFISSLIPFILISRSTRSYVFTSYTRHPASKYTLASRIKSKPMCGIIKVELDLLRRSAWN